MLCANLMRNFFQLGYVTPDLDRAMELYRERYGVEEFLIIDSRAMHPGSPNYLKIGLAWTGDTMIELIEPIGDHPLYACALPQRGFGIQLHHLGYLLPDEATFDAALKDLEAAEIPIVVRSGGTEFFEVAYADARATTGHHLEVVLPRPQGQAMFDSIPRAA